MKRKNLSRALMMMIVCYSPRCVSLQMSYAEVSSYHFAQCEDEINCIHFSQANMVLISAVMDGNVQYFPVPFLGHLWSLAPSLLVSSSCAAEASAEVALLQRAQSAPAPGSSTPGGQRNQGSKDLCWHQRSRCQRHEELRKQLCSIDSRAFLSPRSGPSPP